MGLSSDPTYQRIRRAFVSELHRIDAGFDPSPRWINRRGRHPRKLKPRTPRSSDRWSGGEMMRLLDLHRRGHRVPVIAEMLQRTEGAVRRRLYDLKRKDVFA
jgi:hypothetical protein